MKAGFKNKALFLRCVMLWCWIFFFFPVFGWHSVISRTVKIVSCVIKMVFHFFLSFVETTLKYKRTECFSKLYKIYYYTFFLTARVMSGLKPQYFLNNKLDCIHGSKSFKKLWERPINSYVMKLEQLLSSVLTSSWKTKNT